MCPGDANAENKYNSIALESQVVQLQDKLVQKRKQVTLQ